MNTDTTNASGVETAPKAVEATAAEAITRDELAQLERDSTPSTAIRVPGGNAAWARFATYVDLINRCGPTELRAIADAHGNANWRGDLARYRLSTLH